MTYSWQKLEDKVRSIAALRWKCIAVPEHLGGIDFDAVLRPSAEEIILIEISKNESLDKRIKESNLPIANVILLSIIQRIFFQKGSARKENALYKSGFGQDYDQHLTRDILHLLIRNGIISQAKGKEGPIYKPERAYTHRMRLMMDQLLLSKDPIWLEVCKFTPKKKIKNQPR